MPEVHFAAVVAEGRGVAVCTAAQAVSYIQDGKQISTDAFALALIRRDRPRSGILLGCLQSFLIVAPNCFLERSLMCWESSVGVTS